MIALVLLLGVGGILFLQNRPSGMVLLVEVAGEERYRMSLSEEKGSFSIADMDGHNVFHILEDGVYMQEADCPDGLCIRQGKIQREGESIVCLPNRVVLYLVGGEMPEVDAVTE